MLKEILWVLCMIIIGALLLFLGTALGFYLTVILFDGSFLACFICVTVCDLLACAVLMKIVSWSFGRF